MLPSELLSHESKWTKAVNMRDSMGRPTEDLEKATCFCIYGSLIKCGIPNSDPRVKKLEHDIWPMWLSEWNDSTNYAAVVAALKEVGL